MSAIAGIFFRDGRPVVPGDLDPMARSLGHRGPSIASWCGGPAGALQLGAGPGPEQQRQVKPVLSGPLLLVAEARLDNRGELIAALEGNPAEQMSDEALLLAAYSRWGEQMPEHLLGDFALAIWDSARSRFFCARDHLGVRQLNYYLTPRCFAFATEIKALLKLPGVSRRLDERALAESLLGLSQDQESTLFAAIRRLPAGSSLLVGRETSRQRTYWQAELPPELRLANEADYASAFRDIFVKAVACRVPDAGPVGSALSGGLDSSAVSCVARNLLMGRGTAPLLSFSAVYDRAVSCDERRYIEPVVAMGGIEAHYVYPEQHSPLEEWAGSLERDDEPILNPQIALSRAVYGAAQRCGVRVLLEGIDGDTVVSHGREYLAELGRRHRYLTLWREAGAMARHDGRSGLSILKQIAFLTLPPGLRDQLRPQRALRAQPTGFLRPEFLRRVGLDATPAGGGSLPAREAHLSELRDTLIPQRILPMVDRTAAYFGLEVRMPFMDRRLVEFCLSLPPAYKLRHGWRRWIQRSAMAGILPEQLRWRATKSNLAPSFDLTMLERDRALLDEHILQERSPLDEFVDRAALRTIYTRYLSRPTSPDGMVIWAVTLVGRWLLRAGVGQPQRAGGDHLNPRGD